MTLDQERALSIAQTTQQCFNSEAGKRELAYLKQQHANRTSFHTDPIQMAFLEGERHVILAIEARLALRPQDFVTPTLEEVSDHA